MEERAGAFRVLAQVMYAPRVYSEVIRLGVGSLAVILAVLVLAPAAVTTVKVQRAMAAGLAEVAAQYDDRLPPLKLENGQATVLGEQPAVFPRPGAETPDGDPGSFVVIFDTTGGTTAIPEEYRAGLLVTAETLITRQENGQIREVPIKNVQELTGDFTLDGAFIDAHRASWARLAALVVLAATSVWWLIAKLIQALIMSGVALAAASGRGKLVFGQAFLVGLVSLAPAVLLQVVRLTAGLKIPFFFVLYLIVAGVYSWIGGRRAAAAAALRSPPSVEMPAA